MTRTRNWPLIWGFLLSLFFVLIAIFGAMLAPFPADQQFTDMIRVGDEIYIPSVRPVPPLTLGQFPLGTDHVGRDLLSRLLIAVRPTLVTCLGVVGLRLVIGLAVGLVSGWFNERWFSRAIEGVMSAVLSIPVLILALALIALSEERPLWLFIAVLGLIGWPDVATFYKNETARLRRQGFIEAADALGAGTLAIWWRHVLPAFGGTLPILVAFELSAALLLMAELGFLGMYIGNGLIVYAPDPNSPAVVAIGLTADTPELGQMLSDFTRKMFQAPWEMIAAALAIFLQVFAFNLLGEGLRRRTSRRIG